MNPILKLRKVMYFSFWTYGLDMEKNTGWMQQNLHHRIF